MALHVPKAPGFSSMMKDGSKFFSGLEEAVIRNIGKGNLYLSFLHSRTPVLNYIFKNYFAKFQMPVRTFLAQCLLHLVQTE